jgi:hypothetical protein
MDDASVQTRKLERVEYEQLAAAAKARQRASRASANVSQLR